MWCPGPWLFSGTHVKKSKFCVHLFGVALTADFMHRMSAESSAPPMFLLHILKLAVENPTLDTTAIVYTLQSFFYILFLSKTFHHVVLGLNLSWNVNGILLLVSYMLRDIKIYMYIRMYLCEFIVYMWCEFICVYDCICRHIKTYCFPTSHISLPWHYLRSFYKT